MFHDSYPENMSDHYIYSPTGLSAHYEFMIPQDHFFKNMLQQCHLIK